MSKRHTQTFDLPSGCSVSSVTLQELTGVEEIAAAQRASRDSDVAASVMDEMIAEAIIGVDGQSVAAPYVAWRDWSVRTRAFVTAAFDRMNMAQEAEMRNFLAASFGEAEPGGSD